MPADQPLTLSSYDAGPEHVAYIEFVGVGDALPGLPLCWKPCSFRLTPLQETYDHAWSQFPTVLKPLLEDHSRSAKPGEAKNITA